MYFSHVYISFLFFFPDRSPWPVNIILEFLVTIMQLPLLFFGIFLIFFALTSRTISLKIPFFLSMAAEKKHDINQPSEKSKKGESHFIFISI